MKKIIFKGCGTAIVTPFTKMVLILMNLEN